ncbi:MAG: S46 family peptidase [Bacteroidota bacterium]
MKRLFYLFFVLLMSGSLTTKADDGMWLPNLIGKLNYSDMQRLGCKLTPEQIYDINHSSVKDAIFQLMTSPKGQEGGFCTGEIISEKGLMITNHHCGYSSIAALSSVAHDYLTDGFWAKSQAEELPVEGLAVSRVVRIDDVTARVTKDVTADMDEKTRNATIKKTFKDIEDEACKGTHYNAKVKEMLAGNEYYLFVYEVFTDVRLTGTPPQSIGKFGGDTDNWMWPRHTGDFSMFRIYMGKDGKPANYSKDNVPYAPMHVLPISIKGLKENDFAMIMGFPGSTEKYITSYGMDYKMNVFNPVVVKLFGQKLDIMKEAMNSDDNMRIAYSDTYASIANTWKNFKGEARNLQQTTVIAERKKMEDEFAAWVNADPKRKAEYGNVLPSYEADYKELAPAAKLMIYASLGLLQSSSMVMTTQQFMQLKKLLEDAKGNKTMIENNVKSLKEQVDEFFKEYFVSVDKKQFAAALTMYYKDIDAKDRVKYFDDVIVKKYKAGCPYESINKFVEDVYARSIFTDKARMIKFLDKPTLKLIQADPMMDFSINVMTDLQTSSQPAYMKANKNMDRNERLLIKGLREMNASKSYSPDANSTLRLSYGSIKSYEPFDGAYYKWQTYLDGVIAKMDNSNPEFKVPAKLVDLYNKKDFGQYTDHTGKVPLAFLTNNDITGGNSGSPVLNSNGELIGLAYDGNWEWLTSNLQYNPDLQRTICVDSRYVLFIIDKFAGAKNLIDEMKIIK